MEMEGVVPLSGPGRVPLSPNAAPETRIVVSRAERAGQERAARFAVTWDGAEVRAHRADLGPRALKPLDDPHWAPRASLDLHRRRTRGLDDAIANYLRDAAARHIERILVIHGKGLHSPGGRPVLFDVVLAALTSGAAAFRVRAFRTARATLGGSGALQVEIDSE